MSQKSGVRKADWRVILSLSNDVHTASFHAARDLNETPFSCMERFFRQPGKPHDTRTLPTKTCQILCQRVRRTGSDHTIRSRRKPPTPEGLVQNHMVNRNEDAPVPPFKQKSAKLILAYQTTEDRAESHGSAECGHPDPSVHGGYRGAGE